MPIDTLEKLEEERGRELIVKKEGIKSVPHLDWEILRNKVKKGIRNATLLAIAPNANIGLVAGTSPGIDPRFTQMFSRNKISGKYLEINPNLVQALKKEKIWTKVRDQILENHGDIELVAEIPDAIKKIYKTSFSVSPYAYIEVAARAQKWVDMGLSRNMYLDVRDIDEIMNIYSTAWDKGLKTTYYLHMKPRHNAEQSTIKVNKSESMGRRGFAALRDKKSTSTEEGNLHTGDTVESSPMIQPTMDASIAGHSPVSLFMHTEQKESTLHVHMPEDPMDNLLCESCQ